jgi:hypothetical protein
LGKKRWVNLKDLSTRQAVDLSYLLRRGETKLANELLRDVLRGGGKHEIYTRERTDEKMVKERNVVSSSTRDIVLSVRSGRDSS